MLGNHDAGPEEIDEVVLAFEVVYGLFETGVGTAMDTEDLEEFIPEGLGFSALAGGF